jgi:hypothetical protein
VKICFIRKVGTQEYWGYDLEFGYRWDALIFALPLGDVEQLMWAFNRIQPTANKIAIEIVEFEETATYADPAAYWGAQEK